MPDGSTHAPEIDAASGLRIEHAFARHGHGHSRFGGAPIPTTFVYSDAACTRFICWFHGLADDGAFHPIAHHGRAYRLTLVEADCAVVVDEATHTTLRAFLADNEFEPEFALAVAVRVLAGGAFAGGGGAAPQWAVRKAPAVHAQKAAA